MTIDITPPSKDVSPVAPHPMGKSFLASPVSPTAVCKKEYPSPADSPEADQHQPSPFVQQQQHHHPNSRGPSPERNSGIAIATSNNPPGMVGVGVGPPVVGIARRLARSDRLDTKRYYTAGVIEDIKVKGNTQPVCFKVTKDRWNRKGIVIISLKGMLTQRDISWLLFPEREQC